MQEKLDLVLPRLYKKSKTGAIVICDISVTGDNIKVVTGQLDGKHQIHMTRCDAMNLGKKNETTPEQQAVKEAKAKHIKKIKGGYILESHGEQLVRLPMKVKKYQDQYKNIVFPCWLSPKLNGLNGEFRLEKSDQGDPIFNLYSRGGDKYPPLEHMNEELKYVTSKLKASSLNGELYIHGMHLQDITSAVKKTNDDSQFLKFYVFEIPSNPGTYDEKLKLLNSIDNSKLDYVKIIRSIKAESHEDIEKYLQKCIEADYEGIIIRNATCKYEYNVRSSDAFKYKLALDDEFKIVGYKLDKHGHPVFRCIINDYSENEFNVKPKGTHTERLKIAERADEWIGSWLKVEYETLSKIGIPLKPVGIAIRECDDEGNPIE